MSMKELRIAYQTVIIIVMVSLVVSRSESIFGDDPTTVDLFLLAITTALLLLPIVKEISLGGVTLKKELEETKKEINDNLAQIKNEIVNSVAVSPTFNLGNSPLNDEALKHLEKKFEDTVNKAFQSYATPETEVSKVLSVEDNTMFLFSARHNIESELRRIWGNREVKDSKWPTTVHYMTGNLSETG
ncbi:hypothetical protein, partial [Solemya velum gill symbiont]